MAFDTSNYTTPGTDVAAAWSTSDGPWKLSSFHRATGAYSFVPNLAAGASGQRAEAASLEFVPCAGAAGCSALLAHDRVDQGELPLADAPAVRSLAAGPSRNPLAREGYREQVVAPWSTSYLPYNFRSTTGASGRAGKVFSQAYFRHAFQSLGTSPNRSPGTSTATAW